MRRHVINAVSIASLILVAGCAQHRAEARRDATVAALAKYPGNAQKSDNVRVAAVDHQGTPKRLELINLGDSPIQTPMVWVNKKYVNKAPTIPARGSIMIGYADLIQQGQGLTDLAASNQPIMTVEVQTAGGLYAAEGPARK
jgi:hypothetical protein